MTITKQCGGTPLCFALVLFNLQHKRKYEIYVILIFSIQPIIFSPTDGPLEPWMASSLSLMVSINIPSHMNWTQLRYKARYSSHFVYQLPVSERCNQLKVTNDASKEASNQQLHVRMPGSSIDLTFISIIHERKLSTWIPRVVCVLSLTTASAAPDTPDSSTFFGYSKRMRSKITKLNISCTHNRIFVCGSCIGHRLSIWMWWEILWRSKT